VKPIRELKNIHEGYDIYVVASGASAGYIDQSFFDNKLAIGVNQIWKRFTNLDYIVRKDSNRMAVTIEASKQFGFKTICSAYDCGTLRLARNEGADYVFEHLNNKMDRIDLSVVGTDKIVVSFSTITSAIHIAAYMGAANIIIVGHDCGLLDGMMNIAEYDESPHGAQFYRDFITRIEPQTIALRAKLKEVYGCNVYSLNPFINFGLEGHKYER
jgi:carbonic anhydrase